MLAKADFICFSTKTLSQICKSSPQVQAEFTKHLITAKAIFWLGKPLDFVTTFQANIEAASKDFAEMISQAMDDYCLFFCCCEIGFIEAMSRVIYLKGLEYTIEKDGQPTVSAFLVEPSLKQSRINKLPLRLPNTAAYNPKQDTLPVYYEDDGYIREIESAKDLFPEKIKPKDTHTKPGLFSSSTKIKMTTKPNEPSTLTVSIKYS